MALQSILVTFVYFLQFQDVVSTEEQKKNVLFLVADDMRPQLGAYLGRDFPSKIHPKMYTPNLNKLASKSLLLKRAYVQQALCSPSRTSLLTGRRPDTTHVYNLHSYFRDVGGNFTTIPEYFRQNGYRTLGMGKVFHPGHASGGDDPPSWTEPYYHAPNERFWQLRNVSWKAVPSSTRKEWPLPDEQIGNQAIRWLHYLGETSEPFFMAVGFHKPHLPFVFPEEFLSLYPSDSIRLPDNQYAPINMPEVAWSTYGELRSYRDIAKLNVTGEINTTLPSDKVLELRRAYYASVSYIDTIIGYILRTLDKAGLAENTIISFIGDHGWQLGEHGEWCKHTDFELSVHTPMMVHIPGVTDQGIETEVLTEFVDLYPTLVEAVGLPEIPLCPENGSSEVATCREGHSLMGLISSGNTTWKDRVFYQYPRENDRIMGYSMRTDRYRFTEWVEFLGKPTYQPDWNVLYGIELYDHLNDPDENVNVAHHAVYHETVKELHQMLLAGWRAANWDNTGR